MQDEAEETCNFDEGHTAYFSLVPALNTRHYDLSAQHPLPMPELSKCQGSFLVCTVCTLLAED